MRGERTEGIGITPDEHGQSSSGRDPEERPQTQGEAGDERRRRKEEALDKTLADSFPTSDPPSSIPDPGEEDPYAA